MLRNILAVVAALAANMIVVTLCETMLGAAYPPPAGADLGDPAQFQAYVRTMPTGAFAGVAAGWAAGAWASALAGYLVSGRRVWAAWVGPAFNLFGVLFSVFSLPHPLWVAAIGVAMPIIAGLAVPRLLPAAR